MKFAARFNLGDMVQYSHSDSEETKKGIIQGVQIEALAENYDVYYLVRFSDEREEIWSIEEDSLSSIGSG